MPEFGYLTRRDMEPRPGRTYATQYYLQSRRERRRCQEFVERTIQDIGTAALEDAAATEALMEPLRRFPRENRRSDYTALDIMTDMLTQLQSGKDIPSGILGRWNRLMASAGRDIRMVPESELRGSLVDLERFVEFA